MIQVHPEVAIFFSVALCVFASRVLIALDNRSRTQSAEEPSPVVSTPESCPATQDSDIGTCMVLSCNSRVGCRFLCAFHEATAPRGGYVEFLKVAAEGDGDRACEMMRALITDIGAFEAKATLN